MPSFIARKTPKHSKPEKKSGITRWVMRFFTALGITVFIMMMLSLISFYSLFKDQQSYKPLSNSFVIVQELTGTMPDFNRGSTFFDAFLPPEQSFYGLIHSLSVAAEDDRVKGFAVRLHDGDYSLTQIESLRKAVMDFRRTGKRTYIYTEAFGGFSNGMGEYWLASAFDEIWMQPIGNVSLNGIRIEQPHAGEALEKIGIEPEIVARKGYKTAPEYMTRKEMSPQSRETLSAIAEDVLGKMISDIQIARGVDMRTLEQVIDNSPLSADQALAAGLIDKIGYADEVEAELKRQAGAEKDAFVSVARYADTVRQKKEYSYEAAPKVALILIEGMILESDPKAQNTLIPGDILDAGDVATSIMNAADDDDIQVILMRINSPGGSPTASETIRRSVVYARNKGKYVIVSMGDVAASGGYWVAVDANQIIASDLSLTGSIGVYGGKVNLSGLWDKIGVNWEAVEYGKNAAMWSPNTGYDADELKRLNIMMDNVYDAFTSRVAKGRHMDMNDVEDVAQGRAWTGKAARANGLVDLNGGLDFAMKRAAHEAGEEDWRKMPFVILPEADDPLEDLIAMFGIKVQSPLPQPLLSLKNEIAKAIYYPQTIVTAPTFHILH